MGKHVTLDDVARAAGVSRATASRSLNNRIGVREDVRRNVQKVAKSLGYRPNQAARTLAGGSSSVIGLVLGSAGPRSYSYEAVIVQEVAKAASESDLGLLLVADALAPSQGVRNLLSDGLVSGVVVSVVATRNQWVNELLAADIPSVLIGQGESESPIRTVEVENLESSAEVVGHLLDTGCRRVGTITGPLNRYDAAMRYRGYRLAHERRSLEVDDSLVFEGDFDRDRAYELAAPLLDQNPDGVFGANDQSALAVYRRAIERGLVVPDQLSVAGFDGSFADAYVSPRITSMVQPFREIARGAVGALIEVMGGSNDVSSQYIDPDIFFGDTTR